MRSRFGLAPPCGSEADGSWSERDVVRGGRENLDDEGAGRCGEDWLWPYDEKEYRVCRSKERDDEPEGSLAPDSAGSKAGQWLLDVAGALFGALTLADLFG